MCAAAEKSDEEVECYFSRPFLRLLFLRLFRRDGGRVWDSDSPHCQRIKAVTSFCIKRSVMFVSEGHRLVQEPVALPKNQDVMNAPYGRCVCVLKGNFGYKK